MCTNLRSTPKNEKTKISIAVINNFYLFVRLGPAQTRDTATDDVVRVKVREIAFFAPGSAA
jgi:hypothetical protein